MPRRTTPVLNNTVYAFGLRTHRPASRSRPLAAREVIYRPGIPPIKGRFEQAQLSLGRRGAGFCPLPWPPLPDRLSARAGRLEHPAPLSVTDVHTVAAFDYAAGGPGQPESVVSWEGGKRGAREQGRWWTVVGQLCFLLLPTGPRGANCSGSARPGGRRSWLPPLAASHRRQRPRPRRSIYLQPLSSDRPRSVSCGFPRASQSQRIAAIPGRVPSTGSRRCGAAGLPRRCTPPTPWPPPSGPFCLGCTATNAGQPGPRPGAVRPGHFGHQRRGLPAGRRVASNTDKGTRSVPVPKEPAPRLACNSSPTTCHGIDDFKFPVPPHQHLLRRLNSQDEVAVVYPDGTPLVLTAADGLASPTDTAIRANPLTITERRRRRTPRLQTAGSPGQPRRPLDLTSKANTPRQ